MRPLRWISVAVAFAAATAYVAGCGVDGGGLLCEEDSDCHPHERCDNATKICVAKAAPTDGGMSDALALTGGLLPSAVAGEPYRHSLKVEGGTPPHTWALANAASGLDWLSLDPNLGELIGTPDKAAEPLFFEVRVSDTLGTSITSTFQIAVVECSTGCGDADGGSIDAGADAGMDCDGGVLDAGSDGGDACGVADGGPPGPGPDAGPDAGIGTDCIPGVICREAIGVCDVAEVCNAQGFCPENQVAPATKQCAAEACSAGKYTAPRYCHGSTATCNPVNTISCNGYQCSGTVCATSCTSDSQCQSTHFCQPDNQCAPKRVDGQPCTRAAECVSGACTLSYPDVDGDGFGASNGAAGGYCGVNPPAGRSATKNDCCDSDSRARPGQTTYFDTQRTGCGGFDFNCDAAESKQDESAYACKTNGSCAESDCGGGTGWATSTAPECGTSATYVTQCSFKTYSGSSPCAGGFYCASVDEQRSQACL